MVFSPVANLPANAQDKDMCKDLGWTEVDGSQINLTGTWAAHQNRNCKEVADWQFNFSATISEEGKGYTAKASDGTPMDVQPEGGSGIVFVRDLRGGAGTDKNGITLQTWRGNIERNKDGGIRIYGTWSGAFDFTKKEGYNLDFMLNRIN
jgi:hypothetical protein